MYYEIVLHKQNGAVVGPRKVKIPVGLTQQYLYPNISPGKYYFELIKPTSEEPLKGTLSAKIVNEITEA